MEFSGRLPFELLLRALRTILSYTTFFEMEL